MRELQGLAKEVYLSNMLRPGMNTCWSSTKVIITNGGSCSRGIETDREYNKIRVCLYFAMSFSIKCGGWVCQQQISCGEKLCYVVFLVEGKQKVGSLLFESYLSKLIVNWSFSVE